MGKVMVSGCFDLLHSGHVEFLQNAAKYGDLYVAIGNDETIKGIKGRYPTFPQEERLFIVNALSCVKEAFISQGSGIPDFEQEFCRVKPEYLVVNSDGAAQEKEELCAQHDVQYIILQRDPHEGFPRRSTTEIRSINFIPNRIELCGGWLDQPELSKVHPGRVITIGIDPAFEPQEKSGMAGSTRLTASKIWGTSFPTNMEREKIAKLLFATENLPGRQPISGAQDSIGLVYPGLCIQNYNGRYWPDAISFNTDPDLVKWLEKWVKLFRLPPRKDGYDPYSGHNITSEGVARLAKSSEMCIQAIRERNPIDLGSALSECLKAQLKIFPAMFGAQANVCGNIYTEQNGLLGWKFTGAGGGGYMIMIIEENLPELIKITVRR